MLGIASPDTETSCVIGEDPNLKMELDDSAIIKYDTLYCLYILNDQLLAINVAFSSKPASSSYVWKLDKYDVNA